MYSKRSFDFARDFAPVARIGYGTIAFIVPQSSPARSVQDFVALAKANPGKLTFASSGTGALIHLTGEMFKQAAAIDLTHIPYKGTTQRCPISWMGASTWRSTACPPTCRTSRREGARARGRLARPLSGAARSADHGRAGVPGVVSATDYALFAPAGTPKEIVALLNREVNAVLEMPDLRAKLAAQGVEIVGGTPESVRAEFADEWRKGGPGNHRGEAEGGIATCRSSAARASPRKRPRLP